MQREDETMVEAVRDERKLDIERERGEQRGIFAKSWQVASAELCSYFPSTHPMMSTVM